MTTHASTAKRMHRTTNDFSRDDYHMLIKISDVLEVATDYCYAMGVDVADVTGAFARIVNGEYRDVWLSTSHRPWAPSAIYTKAFCKAF